MCLDFDMTEKIPDKSKKLKVLIAGGGTGGHLYPAIVLAKEFKSRNENTKILFVGTKKGLENTIIPKAGFDLAHISARPLKSISLWNKLKSEKYADPIPMYRYLLILSNMDKRPNVSQNIFLSTCLAGRKE